MSYTELSKEQMSRQEAKEIKELATEMFLNQFGEKRKVNFVPSGAKELSNALFDMALLDKSKRKAEMVKILPHFDGEVTFSEDTKAIIKGTLKETLPR